ncbi:MAG: HlyD family type I secretion periplasmic adaptor subunit [Pseudomonadota bacterium]
MTDDKKPQDDSAASSDGAQANGGDNNALPVRADIAQVDARQIVAAQATGQATDQMERPSPLSRARIPAIAGLAIVGAFFFGVGGWAAFAPLESASIASGQVAVDSRRQTVQHLEGGIIEQIHVTEGSKVEGGEVLVTLDVTRARANLDLLTGQYLSAIGTQARLIAERDGETEITFFGDLDQADLSDEAMAIIDGQQNLFDSRQEYFRGQREILAQRRGQLEQEIEALTAQRKAESTQLRLIREEIGAVSELVNKGLERKPRLLSLQRAAAEIDGNRGEYQGRIAQVQQQIGEVNTQLNDLENQRLTEVTEQLREVEDRIYDVRQRLSAAEDVMMRTEIIAPRAGTIVNMRYHTPGGVIRAGDPVLDLVPSDDRLVIDAQVNPLDIDVLYEGMPAQVRLSAYSQRTTPVLMATLIHLSADAMADQTTGVTFYQARIEVDPGELDDLEDVRLIPGMPAEVMLLTGKRTAMQYIMDPITKSIRSGMREK